MLKLTILIALGFRRVYEKASNWLRKCLWSSLFLDLPVESEPFINAYVTERTNVDEFWSDYTILTGQSGPFISSLKLRFQPVLDCIRDVYSDDKEIHCYRDLESHIKETRILEKILLLEFRSRSTGKLDLNEWKETLLREMETFKDSWHKAVDRILEESEKSSENVILYGGYLESIKRLSRPDYKVEIILLEEYWKSPLDVLRTILWRYGFDSISDKKIERYLKLQKRYLDLVINLNDVDEAHEAWTSMVQNRHIVKY